jgi:hypothetical protein
MQEQSIMEILKWFLSLFLVLGIVSLGLFFFQVQEVNTFKQQINYRIERHGGLTPAAIEELEAYAESFLQGRYEIKSDRLNERVGFGEKVEYTITATYSISFLPIPDIVLTFRGMGVSQIR